MQHNEFEEEEEEEELDLDSIEDEQTLIDLLDETEDIDDRKRIRDRLRKVQFEIKAQRDIERRRREEEREQKIRNRVKECEERKKKTLQMYSEMAREGTPGSRGSRSGSPAPGSENRRKDLVEDGIQQRLQAAEDRKKRLMAAYDHAAKTQPAGSARIVEFDTFKRADVSKLETPALVKSGCTFSMSGGVPKVEKVAPVSVPKPPPDDSHLDPMERAIRARVREAEERKRRTLAAYDMVARSGGAGPKVVVLEEFRVLDVGHEQKSGQRYDPCFRGGLKT